MLVNGINFLAKIISVFSNFGAVSGATNCANLVALVDRERYEECNVYKVSGNTLNIGSVNPNRSLKKRT